MLDRERKGVDAISEASVSSEYLEEVKEWEEKLEAAEDRSDDHRLLCCAIEESTSIGDNDASFAFNAAIELVDKGRATLSIANCDQGRAWKPFIAPEAGAICDKPMQPLDVGFDE